ncbi:MAG: LemA family protein [Chlamydiales bacterium]|nr:LemA family protein [Chlamydiales bacterium]
MWWIILIIIIVIALIVGGIIGIFNRLVRLRNRVKNAWSQIDVQLQRRYDLIPNLVETVKGYMTYEQTTLEKVVEARNTAKAARDRLEQKGGPTEGSLHDLMGAETELRGALANVFALSENYPQLRATENMQRLQEELASTENKVAFSRQAYNDSVMLYNTAQQEFPAVLFAAALGHKAADLFEVKEEEAKKAVKVQF